MSESSSEVDLLIGMTIIGEQAQYKITRAIGAGGMGSVYEAETVGSGRSVALKFLHQELSGEDSSSQERFEREIRVLQDLKAFRGIVQIEDWGMHGDGRMFLAMEFVAAPTLDKIIDDNPNGLPQIQAVQTIIEILSVLEPIHHRRFVHRDLKPHNICVYSDPLAVRLLDFGLSKPYMEGHGYEKVTRRMQGKGSEIPGSPHYMSVEQFLRPKEVDLRTDLYAVGIILYELIAGIPPFRGIYLQDILRQHKENEAPRIENTVDGGPISYRLWDVIEKSLSKKPESRYQSAAEFKEALFDVLNMLNKRRRPRKEIDSKYRIIKKLGTGGNSEVFEVERREDGERMALKIAREGATDWDEETLMNEADRALVHENIVRVFEFGSFEGRPALAMEVMEGGSLEEILEGCRETGMEEHVFYRTMIDVCRGLHHAHQKNIVHRDVKPGNMLRSLDGRVKVCDFGIAKRFEQTGDEVTGAKNTTLAKGTAQYISPEQCDLQGRVDRRADIYSLGVMMYEMLSGGLPFTDGILIMQHLQTDPPPLLVRGNYKNPDALCAIVEKAMKKSPEHRFQSMKEMAQELVRVSKLEPQKKTHKAVTLSTIPDEWKQEMARTSGMNDAGTAMFEQTARRSHALKISMIVAVVIVAVVVGVVMMQKTPQPNQGDGAISESEFNSLSAAIRESKWSDVIEHDLEGIRPDSRGELANGIRLQLGLILSKPVDNAETAETRLNELDQALAALKHIQDDALEVASLYAFTESAKSYVTKHGAVTDGWVAWDTEAAADLRSKITALRDVALSAQPWASYLDEQRNRLREHNLSVLLAQLEEPGQGWTEELSKQVNEVQAQASRDEQDQLSAKVSVWAEKGLVAAANIEALKAFLTNSAAKAANVKSAELLTTTESLSRYRGYESAKRPADNLSDAVGLGVYRGALNPELSRELARELQSAFPVDVSSWKDSLSQLQASGFPVTLFKETVAQAMAGVIESKAFVDFVSEKGKNLNPAARDQMARDWEKSRNAAFTQVASNWENVSGTAQKSWNKSFDGFLADVDSRWKKIVPMVAELDSKPSTERVFEIFDELKLFAGPKPGENKYRSEIEAAISKVRTNFESSGRVLAWLGFTRRFGGLMGFSAESYQNAAAKAVSDTLAKAPASRDWTFGLQGQPLNVEWRSLKSDCIRLKLKAHPEMTELLAKGSIALVGGNCKAEATENGEYSLIGSPSTLLATSGKNGGALSLSFLIELNAAEIGLVGEAVTIQLAGPDAGSYDFEPPTAQAAFGAVSQSSLPLVVTIRDEHLPAAQSFELKLGDVTLELTKKAEGRYERSFKVADLKNLRGADALVQVRDAFENAPARPLSLPESELSRAFASLVEDAAAQETQRFNQEIENLRKSASGQNMTRATTALQNATRSLKELKTLGFGDVQKEADSIQRDGVVLAQSWCLNMSSADQARQLESTYGTFRDALADHAMLSGSSGNLVRDLDSYLAKAKEKQSGTGNDNGQQGPDYSKYSKAETVTALGVEWVRLVIEGVPTWVAATEVSQGFAANYDANLIRKASSAAGRFRKAKFKKGDDRPLAPITPDDAMGLTTKINQNAASSLSSIFGDRVEIDIPTLEEWNAAAAKQTGNRGGFAFGSADSLRSYSYSDYGNRSASWYDALKEVSDDSVVPFRFLSGNVSEIVRLTAQSFGLKGGSMEDACYNSGVKLKVDADPEQLAPNNSLMFSGLRLVVRPKQQR